MKAGVSLKYFVNDCLWKHFLCFLLAPDIFKLIFFDNFGNSKAFHTVLIIKLEQLSRKNMLKFALLGNCFSDLFTKVNIWY